MDSSARIFFDKKFEMVQDFVLKMSKFSRKWQMLPESKWNSFKIADFPLLAPWLTLVNISNLVKNSRRYPNWKAFPGILDPRRTSDFKGCYAQKNLLPGGLTPHKFPNGLIPYTVWCSLVWYPEVSDSKESDAPAI